MYKALTGKGCGILDRRLLMEGGRLQEVVAQRC